MSSEKTTAHKKNAYRIHSQMSQTIFKYFLESQKLSRFQNTAVADVDQLILSSLANVAARAVMKDPLLNVVLKKK